MQNNSMKAR